MRVHQFETIQDVISKRWGHDIDLIFTPKSGKLVSEWRMIFLYVTYCLKIPNIITARYFDTKGYSIHHSTISNSVARLKSRLDTDEILSNEIALIIAECLLRMKYGKGQ
jgi:hypothetical protein